MLVPSTRTQLDRRSFHVAAQLSGTRFHHSSTHRPLVVLWVENPSLHTGLYTPLRTSVKERIILHLNIHLTSLWISIYVGIHRSLLYLLQTQLYSNSRQQPLHYQCWYHLQQSAEFSVFDIYLRTCDNFPIITKFPFYHTS